LIAVRGRVRLPEWQVEHRDSSSCRDGVMVLAIRK
jgi:hypothetical protein